ncbi:flagellar hook-associated family protein [Mycoplana ramosa]|uniref:Flagellin n=1 Tax=Mycoplana ramosa TaxID=40837 RepID=A0ABW3YWZ2_MYCRA
MKTSFVSNMTMQSTLLRTIAEAQTELMQKQKETVTGRHADVGAVLGAKTARTLNLHRDLQRLESLLSTNSLTTQRLSASQLALKDISESAKQVQETLITFAGTETQTQLDQTKASFAGALTLFTNAANTSFSGEYLFSGINTDVMPMNNYLATGSAAKATFDGMFALHFGFPQSDTAQVANITAADMDAFIGVVEASYMGAPPPGSWNTDWSNASSQNMTSRISTSEVVQSSTNANTDGMRKFALGAVIGYELLNLNLSAAVRKTVGDKSLEYIGSAITGIDSERTTLGVSEARVKQANISLEAQTKIMTTSINNLEKVDTNETATRITTLENQLSLAYTLTGRLQNMSLVNYLR